MNTANRSEDIMASIENYSLDHLGAELTITFPQGDIYKCRYANGEWIDNDEDPGTSSYEEWYEIDFRVIQVLQSGPNKNPEFDYITISEKHMPSEIKCDETILYVKDEDQ